MGGACSHQEGVGVVCVNQVGVGLPSPANGGFPEPGQDLRKQYDVLNVFDAKSSITG